MRAIGETGNATGRKLKQEIKYARAKDGVRIAYATAGSGPPLVKAGNWLSHLEFDWETPVWRHLMQRLAEKHTLIRYDARGNGIGAIMKAIDKLENECDQNDEQNKGHGACLKILERDTNDDVPGITAPIDYFLVEFE